MQENENFEELKISFPSIERKSKGNSFLDYFNTIEAQSKHIEKNINFEAENEMLLQPEENTINRISKFAIVSNNSSPTLIKDTPYFNSPLKIQKTRCFRGFDSNQEKFIKILVTNIVDEIVLFEGGGKKENEIGKRLVPEKIIQQYDLNKGNIFKNEMNKNVGRFGW